MFDEMNKTVKKFFEHLDTMLENDRYINCVGGNMHEVKKKKPQGVLKELLDNIDIVEYEKTRREMKEYVPNEEFENFAKAYMEENDANIVSFYDRYAGLVDGVRWQKVNLWKDAQGDDLPEINREVIVLVKALPEHEDGMLKVAFGHRPKEYWDGKNIDTGEVTRYYPKRYDKGGWNSPNIKWWLDCKLPFKEEEEV